jgi:hypothetical protein
VVTPDGLSSAVRFYVVEEAKAFAPDLFGGAIEFAFHGTQQPGYPSFGRLHPVASPDRA